MPCYTHCGLWLTSPVAAWDIRGMDMQQEDEMKTVLDTGRYVVQEGSHDEFGKDRFALDERIKREDAAPLMNNIGWYPSLDRAQEAMMRHRVNGV